MWFNGFKYTNIAMFVFCAKFCIIVKIIIGKGIFCDKIFLEKITNFYFFGVNVTRFLFLIVISNQSIKKGF